MFLDFPILSDIILIFQYFSTKIKIKINFNIIKNSR